MGKTKCGKGSKVSDLVDSNGTPVAIHLTAANHNEVTLVEPLVDSIAVPDRVPEHLVYDMAADSDPLRERLAERGIELVCPHRRNRRKPATQDGRALRKYKRRYLVERSHSWFQAFRRTINRYETTLERYSGWIYLACIILTLRRF